MRDHGEERSSGSTRSIWMGGQIHPSAGKLPRSSSADVCIVGAGITGLSTAYALARAGQSVIVVDAGAIGGGDTARTTAHLASALDDGFVHLESLHGRAGARLAAESHMHAIDFIEHTVLNERIDCDFERVDGYLYLGPKDRRETLEREAEAARRAGLDVDLLETPTALALSSGPCLRFARQAQSHPLRYLAGLVAAIERLGGRIYTGVHIEKFAGGQPTRATATTGEVIEARALVVATNVPVNNRVVIHTKQAAFRSYALALTIPHDEVPAALYWDTAHPYHFVRVVRSSHHDEREMLIVGGEDHRTGDDGHPEGRWDQLEAWARARVPDAGAVVARWSGQVMEPADGLGFIGHNPADAPGVFIATGDSGHGLTHGTLAASMLVHLVVGEAHPYASLYDPRRISLRGLPAFAKENFEAARHYIDWIRPSDVSSEDLIGRGEGATMLEHGRRLAVFRDESGTCHRFSAACPHLGGVVHWNAAEKTWDCPCHGSRFDSEGRVVTGPAAFDLSPVEDDEAGETIPIPATLVPAA
jgi:glycine/D-amino acid oxidase-like deaminating enzyme/nitrite reductase/ring-hydroxylating ferredoxin subunit